MESPTDRLLRYVLATPSNEVFEFDNDGALMMLNVIVQTPGLASGDDEMEYWRTPIGGKEARKSPKGRKTDSLSVSTSNRLLRF